MSSTEQTIGTATQTESLINRGISFNIRDINLKLTRMFQDYSIALNRIMGSELFGKSQVRQIQDGDGVSVEYGKGAIKFRNAIDRLRYLVDNRERVASAIGVTPSEIYANRRNFGKVSNYLRTLGVRYDIGDPNLEMQMYISRMDGNIGSLDSEREWIDYILTQDWVDLFAQATVDNAPGLTDHRIQYLSDLVQGMMKDHEVDYHTGLEKIDFSQFMDRPSGDSSRYQNAFNRLNSVGSLQYGFYELFKPIGGTSEKYLKIRLDTSGELEISGVVGLSDCQLVEWEYGSREYLRSLNTGNQRYDFKISIPFNDENSVLWWKPDDKEPLPDQDGVAEEDLKYRYYKPYETERFLRWFGTTYVPLLDLDTVTKKTICSIPIISNDAQNRKFFSDASNLMGADLGKMDVDDQTSLSLLSLAQKSTIDVIEKEDGQYLRFVVSGHQQTTNLAFKVRGRLLPLIQEKNHYYHTLDFIVGEYERLTKRIMFLELTRTLHSAVGDIWGILNPDENYIPDDWMAVQEKLGKMTWTPNFIDLLRFRTLDYEALSERFDSQWEARRNLIKSSAEQFSGNDEVSIRIRELADGFGFYEHGLHDYIFNYRSEFPEVDDKDKIEQDSNLNSINLSKDVKGQITSTLGYLEQARRGLDEIPFQTTVEDIRSRIQTLNNLIVRLPANPDTNKFTFRSGHIWMDWKEFVDRSLDWLVANGLRTERLKDKDGNVVETEEQYQSRERLYVLYEPNPDGSPDLTRRKKFTATGTDGKTYQFVEFYVDEGTKEPLVDYSYCMEKVDEVTYKAKQNEDGTYIGDRWDAWQRSDFENS